MRMICVSICIFLLLLTGCENKTAVLPPEVGILEGTWEESFEWENFEDQVQPEEGAILHGITRTSTLNLSEDQFILRIQPPRRALIYESDTSYVGLADDTLYTGSYSVRGDSLIFNRYENELNDQFTFFITGNHLQISVLGMRDPFGNILIPMGSFLWAYSFRKTNGDFIRVEQK